MNGNNWRLISPDFARRLLASATPGRWHVGPPDYAGQVTDICAAHGDPRLLLKGWQGLAQVYGQEDNPDRGAEVMVSNANLIASAPDLAATVIALSSNLAEALRQIAADCVAADDYDVLHAAADIIDGGEP